ncbi:MAG: ArsR/SmtB family transcription factor [Acidimicrobiia bacterium]
MARTTCRSWSPRSGVAAASASASSATVGGLVVAGIRRPPDCWALGDSHRVAVIDLLLRAGEPVCVVDIERHLPLAQSTVSYHLKTLVDAGVLDRERRGRWMYYTVRPERLDQLRQALAELLGSTLVS